MASSPVEKSSPLTRPQGDAVRVEEAHNLLLVVRCRLLNFSAPIRPPPDDQLLFPSRDAPRTARCR